MNTTNRAVLFRAALAALAIGAGIPCQGPNLLQNSSFESGTLAPWSLITGSAAVALYGTASLPGVAVANATGGGGLLLRDGGNGIVEQVVTPTSIPPGASLIVEGMLGGGANDWTRLVVFVRDSAGTQIAQHASGYVTERDRNLEAVHLYRKLVVPVPPLAASFAIRVEFVNQCCNVTAATADQITAHLVTGSTIPSAVPLGTELLLNGGLESGWTAGSPLTLTGGGWQGVGSSSSVVLPYSNSSGTVPSGVVSCIIGGAAPNPSCVGGAAGNLLQHTGSDSAVVQRIDVRGSTPQFASGAIALHYGAHLGGIGGEADTARIEVRFLDLGGTVLRSGQLGPVGPAERNFESVLVRREGEIVVPANTAFIDVMTVFTNPCCNVTVGMADNISAELVPSAPVAPLMLNVNLVPNGSFENGSLLNSPLELDNVTGWFGAGSNRNVVPQYGSPLMPSAAFAAANGLGGLLLRDGGAATLRAEFDLRGSQPLVVSGRMAMQASAWLGGVTNQADTAEVRIRFETIAGVPVGAITILPAVTAAERQNVTTLIQRRSSPFAVPVTAAKAILQIEFSDPCCNGAFGLADDVRLVAFDVAQQTSALPYPGTSAHDLTLATGIDELPRSGFGFTVKQATAGQVLRTQVGSPAGSLDGAPVLLALDAFVTGQPPVQLLPDVWIDPRQSLFLYNGWFGTSFAPVVVPLSQGGNVYAQLLPPGLSGVSLLLQAVALPTTGTPSPNGLYFATDAHEIRVQ